MKIIGNSIPCPFQMEAPVSCVIPDLLEKEHNINLKQLTTITNENLGEGSILNKFLKRILDFSFVIDLLVDILVSILLENESNKIAQEILKKIDNFVLEKIRKKVEADEKKLVELRQIRDESIRKIKDETTALKSAVKSFLYISNKLSQDFPNSEIRVD